MLSSWNDTPTRRIIEAFVARVTDPAGPDFVPERERVAVFDNDGTLWVEQPMPAQLHHILERLGAMVQAIRHSVSVSPGRPRSSTTSPGWAARSSSTTTATTRT